jgi:hypothetical protein
LGAGRWPRRDHNLLVQIRNRCADRIDLLHIRRDASIDVRVQIVELRTRGVQIAGKRLCIAEQRLARRGRVGLSATADQPL